MCETPFILLKNPPQNVFDELIQKAAETDGWAHQPYDYAFWRENFDDFWFFAIIEQETSKLVCGACLAKWQEMYSIGLFYCVKEHRGNGHGSKIFKEMMNIVGDSEACLTGAVDMVEKYARNFGFDKIAPYWHLHSTIQMEHFKIPCELQNSQKTGEYTTKDWKSVDLDALNAYDLTICAKNRQKIMKTWFGMDQVYAKVAFDKNNQIVGYCTIRVVNLNRLCACPFYADNLQVAERLLADVMAVIPDYQNFDNVFFWHPETNENMRKLLEKFSINNKYSMEVDFKTQFRHKFIEVPEGKVFSVADSTHQFA